MNFDNKITYNLDKVQKSINYNFKDVNLILNALTHSSYVNENPHKNIKCNERLEFLGDAILDFVIGDYVYRNYDMMPEGELTRIRACTVCEASLADCAKKLDIGSFLLLGIGEEKTGGRSRTSLLSDAFEALIAAIYLDGGINKVSKWILNHLEPTVIKAVEGKVFVDYKTKLQEFLQKYSKKKILYDIIEEVGPEHDKKFHVKVTHNSKVIGEGKGRSKKEAEQNAAEQALKNLK